MTAQLNFEEMTAAELALYLRYSCAIQEARSFFDFEAARRIENERDDALVAGRAGVHLLEFEVLAAL